MKQIRKITNPIIKSVEKVLNRALDNVYLNTALKVFLILYAALAAPKFPPKLAFLMDNVFVRIGVSFLIVFMAIRDPGIALMIAVAFVITLQTANKLRLMDGSLSQALPGETSWLPSAKEGFFNADTADVVRSSDSYRRRPTMMRPRRRANFQNFWVTTRNLQISWRFSNQNHGLPWRMLVSKKQRLTVYLTRLTQRARAHNKNLSARRPKIIWYRNCGLDILYDMFQTFYFVR